MTHPSSLLKQYQGRAKKRYGQHFLASAGIVDKICDGAELDSDSRVLEIGPGLGVLTERLIHRAAEVVAMELDPEMVRVLEDRFGESKNFRLLHQDASKVRDWRSLLGENDWIVVANLPYNVGTGIVTSLLNEPSCFSRLVVMLQKEVAERMIAPEGHRKRGSLSVFCQARASVSRVTRAPAGAFHPPPKVDSWVIRLDLHSNPDFGRASPEMHERVVKAGFSAPRKAIRNGLAGTYGRTKVDAVLAQLGIEARLRPAALTGAQWIALAEELDGGRP